MHRDLHAHGELEIVARNHGRGREPADDLVGDVRPGEDGDRTVAHERREPLAGRGVETLGQADDRRVAAEPCDDLGEHPARNRDHDELGVPDGREVDRRGRDPVKPRVRGVARVASGSVDGLDLLGIARRERHLVAVVAEKTGDCGSPGTGPDDDDSHSEVTKSMETGTPSREKRLRSSFSTQ